MSSLLTLIVLCFLNLHYSSCLRFHSYYGDGMVLQRDVPVQVWGYEDLMNDVEASLQCVSKTDGRRSQESVTVASHADGVWSMELPSRDAENICTIEVRDADRKKHAPHLVKMALHMNLYVFFSSLLP